MAIPSAETKRSRTNSHKRGVRLSLLYARKHRHFIKEKEKNRVYRRANNKLVAHKGLTDAMIAKDREEMAKMRHADTSTVDGRRGAAAAAEGER